MPDEIQLDTTNKAFSYAVEAVLHRGQSIFLTGKAGTGKTTFLKHMKTITEKMVVILAPTGVAAINAGGQTIHSFFNMDFGPLLMDDTQYAPENIQKKFKFNKKKIELINNIEILVIDEVSMVRADLLDMIDRVLKTYRNSYEPFGGVQMVLIGDVFQLPPVVNKSEWGMLNRFYKSAFFFSAKAFQELGPQSVELDKIYRQDDDDFIDLLNKIRVNEIAQHELDAVNVRAVESPHSEKRYITLSTHNYVVNTINKKKLDALTTDAILFQAEVLKEFPTKAIPTDVLLELKEGAQVMFVKNDLGDRKRYYNGTIGTIIELKSDFIKVEVENYGTIIVEQAEWENIKFEWDEKEQAIKKKVIGTFKQYPLRLAWAITVHKSQGLTFDHVIADLDQSFSEGQVYVALSRCSSLEGLVLTNPIPRRAIKANPIALRFMEWMRNGGFDDYA